MAMTAGEACMWSGVPIVTASNLPATLSSNSRQSRWSDASGWSLPAACSERLSTSHRATIFTLLWLATPFIVLPPMPPTPMEATWRLLLGAALFRIAGAAKTVLAAAADWARKRRRERWLLFFMLFVAFQFESDC